MSDLTKLREATNKYIDELEAKDIALEEITSVAEEMMRNTKMASVTFRDRLLNKNKIEEQDIDDVLPKLIQMAIDCGNINFFPSLLKESKD